MRKYYRVLRYLEKHKRTPYPLLKAKYGEIVSEMRFYDDIDVDANDAAQLTKNGRLLLAAHRNTVANTVLSIISAVIAVAAFVVSLFIE